MKLWRIISQALVPTILVALVATGAAALAEPAPVGDAPDAQPTRHARAIAEDTPMTDSMLASVVALQDYTRGVMNSWSPAPSILPVSAYDEIARDIADVVLDPRSPRFADDPHGVRGALLLAALGYFEGARYAAYVDNGMCNDPEWRASPEGREMMRRWGDCDHGNAYSIYQIHPGKLWLDGCASLGAPEDVTPAKLADRAYATRVAFCIAYRSMASTGTLAGYTGESPVSCPKADLRLDFALRAIEKHPWAN